MIDGNVNQAYRYLNSRLNQNNVRTELRRQVRHEKKGVKRRRLTSERWRRRFAEEVRGAGLYDQSLPTDTHWDVTRRCGKRCSWYSKFKCGGRKPCAICLFGYISSNSSSSWLHHIVNFAPPPTRQ